MKKTVLRALALGLTMAFATGYAVAKDDKDKEPGSTSSGKAGSSGAPPSSTGTSSSTSSSSSQMGSSVRLSKLMHQSIKGQSGDRLGTVHDVIADPSSGQLQFVILSLSGSAAGAPGSSSSSATGTSTDPSSTGTPGSSSSTSTAPGSSSGIGSTRISSGGNLVAVPWSLLQQSGGASSSTGIGAGSSGEFTLNVDRSKLQSAPAFNASTWPSMDASWSQQVYSHFGVSPASATGAPGSGSGSSGSSSGSQPTPGVPPTPGTPDIAPPSSGSSGTPGTSSGTAK